MQYRLRTGSVLEKYRCRAVSVTGFVQRLVDYLRHGYWFYVTGEVPAGKDPREVDEKLIEKYGIAVSDSTRYRRKRAVPRRANMQYIRHGRFFVLLCTHGKHDFFLPMEHGGESVRDERGREVRIRSVRAVPIRYAGYSISVREGGNLRKLNPEDPHVVRCTVLASCTGANAKIPAIPSIAASPMIIGMLVLVKGSTRSSRKSSSSLLWSTS